jgi:hypothetical protein
MLRCATFSVYGIHLIMAETRSYSSYHFINITWYCTYNRRKFGFIHFEKEYVRALSILLKFAKFVTLQFYFSCFLWCKCCNRFYYIQKTRNFSLVCTLYQSIQSFMHQILSDRTYICTYVCVCVCISFQWRSCCLGAPSNCGGCHRLKSRLVIVTISFVYTSNNNPDVRWQSVNCEATSWAAVDCM